MYLAFRFFIFSCGVCLTNSIFIVCFCMVFCLLTVVSAISQTMRCRGCHSNSNFHEGGRFIENDNSAVCVVGGGFAGLYTALGVCEKVKPGTIVYLIDPKDQFVFLPLLYEILIGLASLREVAPRYLDITKSTSIRYIKGLVHDVDFENSICKISKYQDSSSLGEFLQEEIHYDFLIVACGSIPRKETVPGQKEFSTPFYTLDDTLALQLRLREMKNSRGRPKISIVGAGFSGIELTTNIADYFSDHAASITLVDRGQQVLSAGSKFNRKSSEAALKKRRVHIRHNISVVSVVEDGVNIVNEVGDNEKILSDLVIFTAGTEPCELVKRLKLSKHRYGRLLTRPTMQSVDYDNVFCLGDCAVIDGAELPGTAQVAMQQSRIVISNLLQLHHCSFREHNGDSASKLQFFHFKPIGEMLSLGFFDGSISSFGGWFVVSGPIAAIGRRLVYALRMPTLKQSITSLSEGIVKTLQFIFHR